MTWPCPAVQLLVYVNRKKEKSQSFHFEILSLARASSSTDSDSPRWKLDRDLAKPHLRMEWSGVASQMLWPSRLSSSLSPVTSSQRLVPGPEAGTRLVRDRVMVAKLAPGLFIIPASISFLLTPLHCSFLMIGINKKKV